MLGVLLERQSYQIVNRYNPVTSKLLHNDALVVTESKIKSMVDYDRYRDKRKFKKHFIENLFLSRFQCDVLEYPQIKTLKEVESLRKQAIVTKSILGNIFQNEHLGERKSDKVVSTIKKLELSGFKLPKRNNGFGFLESEFTYLLETLNLNPSLGKAISENEDFGIHLINLYGNPSQKETYLSKLASGESLSCFAHLECEPLVKLDPVSISTTAVMAPDGVNFIVSGKKNWVYNASYADVIIFSALANPTDLDRTKSTLFLVNKNFKGITVHNPVNNKIGLPDLNVCEVTFDNVIVPESCILGNIHEGNMLIKKILANGYLCNGAQYLTLSRKLLSMAISHCTHNKIFSKNMYERDFYQTKIGDIVTRLYSLESMIYLLKGRVDIYDDPDVFLESVIVKIYASDTLQFILKQVFGILGPKIFDCKECINEITNASHFYAGSDGTNDYLKLVVSTAGLKHVLKYRAETNPLRKIMNTFNKQNFRKWINFYGQIDGTTDLLYIVHQGALNGYLHLMFKFESYLLEDCVFNLKESVNYLLRKNGESLMSRQHELKLLSDFVINIYAITATLARASRAYCLAVRNKEVDAKIVQAEVYRLVKQCKIIKKTIKNSSNFQNFEKIDSTVLLDKSYSENYSIIKNFNQLS